MRQLKKIWDRMWFQNETTLPLDVIRAGLGFILLFNYISLTPYLHEFYGDQGWVSRSAIYLYEQSPWHQSIFFYLNKPWQWGLVNTVFILVCMLFTLGWKTRWVKWLVLIGHISFAYRNPPLTYGVDGILSSGLFLLCLAPIGQTFSIDRWSKVHRAKRLNLDVSVPVLTSNYTFLFRRLLQIQMAIFFLFAGIEKLRGTTWWSGDALWIAVNNYEFTNIPVTWLAENYWLVNILTFSTLLLEAGYFFLIWQRSTRPYFLTAAIILHLGIAIMLGLYLFSATMIICHLSFMRREWYQQLGGWWRNKTGSMEMIYDGHCGFCKNAMAWLLAFDGLNQIQIRDYRTNPSPQIADELMDKALYLIPGGREPLPGFDAYRYAVLRIPGLWWLIPLFYIPFFSRFFGRKIYNWIASHRQQISQCVVPTSDNG
jgi:predicted DCC family thiol-disulfide oxidoreductase YuxK